MTDRVDNIRLAIEKGHDCRAIYVGSVVVREFFDGDSEPIWEGVVEVFRIQGNPTATTAYGWVKGQLGPPKQEPEYIVVLGVPPINSAQDAVKAAIVSMFKSMED